MRALAEKASRHSRVYLTGGSSAVLLGWRDATIDIDLEIVPEDDRALRAIPEIKEELQVNVELASPAHFIPALPGWEARSTFIRQEDTLAFYHYDLYAQALSKIERFHARDILDVHEMLRRGLVEPKLLESLFEQIVPELYRFPALDPTSFRKNLESVLAQANK
jgi:hypothetical protein